MPARSLHRAILLALVIGPALTAGAEGKAPIRSPGPRFPGGEPVETVRVSVLAAGDVIPHDTVLKAAESPAAPDGYDFAPMLEGVKGIASAASLAIINFEATMSGDGSYSGYPSFDAPPSLASAIADSGFDVAAMANNHMFDQGIKGFETTLPLLRARSLSVAGARLPGEERFVLRDGGGVRIAVIAYSYAGGTDAAPVFNGFAPPAALLPRINYFVPGSVARPAAEFAAAAARARAAGARIVIAYVHWGEEYEAAPRDRERAFAALLAESGADAVFGTHPHVVQGTELIQARDGRLVPVFYSLGNFLSNQRRDTVDNPSTEDGIMAIAEFDVPLAGGRPSLVSARAAPTWVRKTELPSLSFKILGIGDARAPSRETAELEKESLARTARSLGIAYDPALAGFPLALPPATIMPVPYFGQTLEWPWGGDFMGNARALIADNGCVMASTAMILSYYGVDTDPRRLDRVLAEGGGYLPMSFQGEDLGEMGFNLSAIPRFFPSASSVRTQGPVKSDEELKFVRSALASGKPVILLLMSPIGFSHAVVAVGVSGRDILINDPLDPLATSLLGAYGRKNAGGWPLAGVILTAAVYEPAEVRAAKEEARSPTPAPAVPPASRGSQPPGAPPPAMPMVRIQGGTFTMGSKDGQSYMDEWPPHPVSLPAFYAAPREVTVGEFEIFVRDSGYVTVPERTGGAWILEGKVFARREGASWRNPGFAQGSDEPVVCVAWEDAVAYCNYLSAREGRRPAYRKADGRWECDWKADGFRLPSEAEWEFAAKAGRVPPGKGDFAGAPIAEGVGWVLGNSGGRTKASGSKPPNANGLYDTVGGVFEWCWDRFGQNYYAASPASSPIGPDRGITRVARGGSWASRPRNARSSQRYARLGEEACSYLGFRVFASILP